MSKHLSQSIREALQAATGVTSNYLSDLKFVFFGDNRLTTETGSVSVGETTPQYDCPAWRAYEAATDNNRPLTEGKRNLFEGNGFHNYVTQSKAYYPFTEGAETTDTSGNTNTLTAIGVPVQGTPKWGTGCVGYGTSQAHSAVDGASFQPAGNWSVSAWVRTIKTGTLVIPFQTASQNTAVAGIKLYISTANVARIISGKNSGTTLNTDYVDHAGTTNTMCNGAWHHLVGTYDGTKVHLYVDGAEEGTGTAWTNAAVFAATNYVRVGCGSLAGTNANFVQGIQDETAFFPSDALSLAEVQSLYAASINDASNSAIKAKASAVYLFEDGAQLTDSSTAGTNTLTAIGTPTTVTAISAGSGGTVFLGNSSAYSAVDADILKPTGAFTVGAWVKTPSTGAVNNYLFQSMSINTNWAGFSLRQGTSNFITFVSAKNTKTTAGTDYQVINSSAANLVNDNRWHFVVGTWDGSYLRLYIDGVTNGTPVVWANAPAYAATNYVRVGTGNNSGANTGTFMGQLDNVFLINGRALSASEIWNYYKSFGR